MQGHEETVFRTLTASNSAVVATLTTVFCVVGAFSSYAIARLPIRFKPLILGAILTVTMFPRLSIVGPMFMMLRDLGTA